MKQIIHILDLAQSTPFVVHEWAGRQFVFKWSNEHNAYVYEPKTDEEANTIISTPRTFCPWVFLQKYVSTHGDSDPRALAEKDAQIARMKERIAGLESELDQRINNEKASMAEIDRLTARLRDVEAKPKRPLKPRQTELATEASVIEA